MYNIIIVQLVVLVNLIEGSEKADSLNDEHHGLHVHHHDQWVHPNILSNETALQNVTKLREQGINDVLGIIKKEETAEHIMIKVKDILEVTKTNKSGDIIEANDNADQPKNYVELYLDLIDSMNEVRETKESDVFVVATSNIDIKDNGNIDYTEYDVHDYFDEGQSDYEGDDDYFDIPDNEKKVIDPVTEDSKQGILKKEPRKIMKMHNTAFPELLTDLLYA